jgi:hypothetical protein
MPSVALSYHVDPASTVTVRAQIGDAQGGGHAIFLDQQLVAQGELDTGVVTLGPGAGLVGRLLTVSSVAVDIQPAHDHVSARTTLTGGFPDPMPVPQVTDAPTNGAVSFLTLVTFV